MSSRKTIFKKILKVLGLTLLSIFGIVSILFVILYFLAKDEEKYPYSINFPEGIDTVMIPFDYNENGDIVTKVFIEGDTLDFIVDTGASGSYISSNYKNKSAFKKTTSNRFGYVSTDAGGITKKLPQITLKNAKWGDVEINNLNCAIYDSWTSIIGGDVLRNFCVKVDNEKNVMILSQRLDSVPIDMMKVPFIETGNTPFIYAYLNGIPDSLLFLFDTGGSFDLKLNETAHQILKKNKEPAARWREAYFSAFAPKEGIYSKDSTVIYILSELSLGDKIFKNTILTCLQNDVSFNSIGSIFTRRFKSYIIDYPNKKLYFELPAQTQIKSESNHNPIAESKKTSTPVLVIPEDAKMDFSGKEISAVNAAYGNLLFSRINSLGLNFNIQMDLQSERNDLILVSALAVNEANKGIQIGDTLVGIDTILFAQRVARLTDFDKRNFKIENDVVKQARLYSNTIHKNRKVDFHFIKNGHLKTVHTVRDTVAVPPLSVYSYGNIAFSNYYRLSFGGQNTYNLHFPWWSLVGKQFEIYQYVDGEKNVMTN